MSDKGRILKRSRVKSGSYSSWRCKYCILPTVNIGRVCRRCLDKQSNGQKMVHTDARSDKAALEMTMEFFSFKGYRCKS